MFKVQEKGTSKVLVVYAFVGMQFMFYNEADDCWFFGEIDNYRPYEGEI